jgi:membrane protein implicated in regulation of membrane protease activity
MPASGPCARPTHCLPRHLPRKCSHPLGNLSFRQGFLTTPLYLYSLVATLRLMTPGNTLLPLLTLALAGVIFIACCQIISLLWHRYRGTRTTGRVISLEEQELSDDDGPVFTPIVQYRVGDQTRRIKSLIAMAPALYQVGQDVPVYSFPNSPASGRIVTPREFFKWIIVILSCLLFLALLLNVS